MGKTSAIMPAPPPKQASKMGAVNGKSKNGVSQSTGKSANTREGTKKWYQKAVKGRTAEELLGEYRELRQDPDGSRHEAYDKAAAKKMRHKAVVLYDETRVKLSGPGDGFIHASFVDGWGERRRAWIIAMAPVLDTVTDWWAMVWQESVPVIVMLCLTSEKGAGGQMQDKCAQYWPKEGGSRRVADGYMVECEQSWLDTPVCEGQQIRISALWLWHLGSRRRVYHYQYLTWGDHEVPKSHNGMLNFIRLVESRWQEMAQPPHYSDNAPVLVHCSAGVGRSGTFVSIANALKGVSTGPSFSVKDLVRKARTQRFQVVQNEAQYLYIYQCIVAQLKKNSVIPPSSPIPK